MSKFLKIYFLKLKMLFHIFNSLRDLTSERFATDAALELARTLDPIQLRTTLDGVMEGGVVL